MHNRVRKEQRKRNKRRDLEAAKDAREGADEGEDDVRDVDDGEGKDVAHVEDASDALLSLFLGEGVREQVRAAHVAARAIHRPRTVRDSEKERSAGDDRSEQRDVLLDGQLLHAVEKDCGGRWNMRWYGTECACVSV